MSNTNDWFEGAKRVVNSETPVHEAHIGGTVIYQNGSAGQKLEMHDSLVNSYMAMGEAAKMANASLATPDTATPVKKNFFARNIVAIIEGALLIAVGVLAVIFIPKWTKDNTAELLEQQQIIAQAVSDVQLKVDALYIDGTKTALIEGYSDEMLTAIRTDMLSLPEGADASGIEAELTTISKYYADDAFLKKLESDGYNIASDFVLEACDYVQTNMLSYSVQGLQTSVKARVNALLNERAKYYKLSAGLLSEDITKVDKNFKSDDYYAQFETMAHSVNKNELIAYTDLLVATATYNSAVADVEAVEKDNIEALDAAQAQVDMAKSGLDVKIFFNENAKKASADALTSQKVVEVIPVNEGTTPEETTSDPNESSSETSSTVSSAVESTTSDVTSSGVESGTSQDASMSTTGSLEDM